MKKNQTAWLFVCTVSSVLHRHQIENFQSVVYVTYIWVAVGLTYMYLCIKK